MEAMMQGTLPDPADDNDARLIAAAKHMNTSDDKTLDALRLRAAAEAQLASAPQADARQATDLLHELQVYQIELEMQNDTLRRAQIKLEASRDRYVDLYDFAPVGYLTLTADGMIEESNLAAATLLGMNREDLLQRRFIALIAPDDQPRWMTLFLNMLEQDGKGRVELSVQRGDGSVLQVQLECAPQKVGAGGTAMRIVLTDISEILEAAALRDSGEAYRSIVETSLDGFWCLDGKGKLLDVNLAYCRLSGYTRAELLGMRISDLEAKESAAETAMHVRRIIEHGADQFESLHRRKDGSIMDVDVSTTYKNTEGGRFFVFLRDITARKLAAASLRALSHHLVEAQEDVRRRLAGELHDRTSPNLAAIQINLDAIAKAISSTRSTEIAERLADTQALLEDTDASIREISTDLRSPLLDYAGLGPAVQAYADRFADRTGVAVEVIRTEDATRLAPALESLLFRIFQEALTNSLKHAQARSIKVILDLDAHPIVLGVTDDGVGFDPARVSSGASSTGIGLGNMREMAEFAGGQLLIESQPGQGAHVQVRLPV
jgi:PAS domain S-box-containing protein